MPTYQKYFVYVEDSEDEVFKIAIPAVCEAAAAAAVAGFGGEVIAVKDVTDVFHISNSKVFDALTAAGFGKYEADFITRLCLEMGITE